MCEFKDASNDYSDYDYDYHYDYDYAEEDEEECLQSCLKKSNEIDHAAGCYFDHLHGQCIFLKSGMIVGAVEGTQDEGTCWKFHRGNMLHRLHFSIIHHKIITYGGLHLYIFIVSYSSAEKSKKGLLARM